MLKSLTLALLLLSSASLAGCDLISKYLPKDSIPEGAYRAELLIYANGKEYKYSCVVDPTSKALADCSEVQ